MIIVGLKSRNEFTFCQSVPHFIIFSVINMNLKSTSFFIFLFAFSLLGHAQVRIHGHVSERDHMLSDVVIEKYVDGKRSADILANNKGKYAIDLPFNVLVELVFKADKKVPLKLTVDTHPLSFSNKVDQSYDVPFNMELFPYYSDLAAQLDMQESFGSIVMSGTGTATFQFKPNRSVLFRIKEVKAEAFKLFDSGKEAEKLTVTSSKKTSDVLIEREVKLDGAIEQELIEERVAEKVVNNTENLLEAKSEEMRQARESLAKEQALSENKEFTQQDHQSVNKQNKAEAYFERKSVEESSTNMRIERHQDAELLAEAGGLVIKESKTSVTPTIVNHRNSNNGFLKEDYLQFKIGDQFNVLVYKRYDWKLFSTEYYYLNGEEITKEEYELEKMSVL
jgi:hypothetical protein